MRFLDYRQRSNKYLYEKKYSRFALRLDGGEFDEAAYSLINPLSLSDRTNSYNHCQKSLKLSVALVKCLLSYTRHQGFQFLKNISWVEEGGTDFETNSLPRY